MTPAVTSTFLAVRQASHGVGTKGLMTAANMHASKSRGQARQSCNILLVPRSEADLFQQDAHALRCDADPLRWHQAYLADGWLHLIGSTSAAQTRCL